MSEHYTADLTTTIGQLRALIPDWDIISLSNDITNGDDSFVVNDTRGFSRSPSYPQYVIISSFEDCEVKRIDRIDEESNRIYIIGTFSNSYSNTSGLLTSGYVFRSAIFTDEQIEAVYEQENNIKKTTASLLEIIASSSKLLGYYMKKDPTNTNLDNVRNMLLKRAERLRELAKEEERTNYIQSRTNTIEEFDLGMSNYTGESSFGVDKMGIDQANYED